MALQDHLNADRKENYMKLSKNEAKSIKAGASLSASLINSLIKGFNSFLDIGRYLGSGLRRLISGRSCPIG